ncbi:MAG TPA: hypothetical protein DCK76_03795 [Desulfotomaculum sp.]|nr:MAG: hypothetical protein XD84_0699 [Desulfotomaculum sp. 46_80]HAG10509.1 hypothetical protein [Desulfotomaculum sp.]HBY04068.1 hypothetical protein [Desulfotomaculum sp.]
MSNTEQMVTKGKELKAMFIQRLSKMILKKLAMMAEENGTFKFYVSDVELYYIFEDFDPKKINLAVEYLSENNYVRLEQTSSSFNICLNTSGYDRATNSQISLLYH